MCYEANELDLNMQQSDFASSAIHFHVGTASMCADEAGVRAAPRSCRCRPNRTGPILDERVNKGNQCSIHAYTIFQPWQLLANTFSMLTPFHIQAGGLVFPACQRRQVPSLTRLYVGTPHG